MLRQPRLHVEVAPDGNRFRSQVDARPTVGISLRDDVIVHWVRHADSNRLGQPLPVALIHVIRCLPEFEAVCAVDSALNKQLVKLGELHSLAGAPARRILSRCDASADSGVESIFRLNATAAGFRFRTQARLPGGRVDFLFGDRLVVEVDGAEHHAGYEAFVADRERDAWHTAIGYVVVRFTYSQVVHRWHEVESVLRMLHARGDHFWPARIRSSARHAV